MESDLTSTVPGSQGQWFTALLNFVQSSQAKTPANDPGLPVTDLHFTYWALNDEDNFSILGANYAGLENPRKVYSFLCFVEAAPFALPYGPGTGQCGSTGNLPNP